MFAYFGVPIPWSEVVKRTVQEIGDDNCLGLAAQLAFYFLMALSPALVFLVALIGYARSLATVFALVAFPAVGLVWLRHSLETTLPDVSPPDLMSIFFDTTPVTVVFTFDGQQVLRRTTADDIRSNLTLWRHMHLAEWNTVPEPFDTRVSTNCLHGIEACS